MREFYIAMSVLVEVYSIYLYYIVLYSIYIVTSEPSRK